MDVDRELDHLVGRNALVLVFRMGKSGVGKVERSIQLFSSHRRVGGIDHRIYTINFLKQPLGVPLVGFLLNMPEVLGLCLLVSKAFFVAMKDDVVALKTVWNLFFLC